MANLILLSTIFGVIFLIALSLTGYMVYKKRRDNGLAYANEIQHILGHVDLNRNLESTSETVKALLTKYLKRSPEVFKVYLATYKFPYTEGQSVLDVIGGLICKPSKHLKVVQLNMDNPTNMWGNHVYLVTYKDEYVILAFNSFHDRVSGNYMGIESVTILYNNSTQFKLQTLTDVFKPYTYVPPVPVINTSTEIKYITLTYDDDNLMNRGIQVMSTTRKFTVPTDDDLNLSYSNAVGFVGGESMDLSVSKFLTEGVPLIIDNNYNVLIYGSSGCGKTYLLDAINNICEKKRYNRNQELTVFRVEPNCFDRIDKVITTVNKYSGKKVILIDEGNNLLIKERIDKLLLALDDKNKTSDDYSFIIVTSLDKKELQETILRRMQVIITLSPLSRAMALAKVKEIKKGLDPAVEFFDDKIFDHNLVTNTQLSVSGQISLHEIYEAVCKVSFGDLLKKAMVRTKDTKKPKDQQMTINDQFKEADVQESIGENSSGSITGSHKISEERPSLGKILGSLD